MVHFHLRSSAIVSRAIRHRSSDDLRGGGLHGSQGVGNWLAAVLSLLVTVEAAYTKNRKLAEISLRSDLAVRLSDYLRQRPRPTLSIDQAPKIVWPGTWTDDAADMIRIDLAAATIPYAVDGKDYDFHSLRHQFITGLALAGVSLKAAQELATHSKPELTANVYTHLSIKDTAADVERLNPVPTGERPQRQQATGTDGWNDAE